MGENGIKYENSKFQEEVIKNNNVDDGSKKDINIYCKMLTNSVCENQSINNVENFPKENDKKESKNENDKRKIKITRELSEGEASSDFDAVSSAGSVGESSELVLSSENDNLNFIVEVKNELAIQNSNKREGRRGFYHSKHSGNDSTKVNSHRNRLVHYSRKPSPSRHDSHRNDRRSNEYWKRNSRCEERRRRECNRRAKSSSERGDLESSERRRSYDRELHRNSDYNYRRSKRPRSSDRRTRSRSPLYKDYKRRRRDGISDKVHSPKSTSCNKTHCRRDNNHSSNVDRQRDLKDKTQSSCSDDSRTNYNSSRRKRSRSREGKTSSNVSVWNRLESKPVKYRKDDRNDLKNELSKHRKKERTPFLEELEKKLKVAELLNASVKKSSDMNKDSTNSSNQGSTNPAGVIPETVPVPVPVPYMPPTSNCNSVMPYPAGVLPEPYSANMIFFQSYTSFPTISLDNLPLVPGPTGLPVHITLTGEQIPYDIDGRRIPVGPNGHYLPVDPTGRLFPHIISPGNIAVPIYISDDGVLRLPNSEPVPYGPPHQLPVNIDGSVIVIGPDSKPLYPCPNLPTGPSTQIKGPSIAPPWHEIQTTVKETQEIENNQAQPELPKTYVNNANLTDSSSTLTNNVDDKKPSGETDENLNQNVEMLTPVEIKTEEVKTTSDSVKLSPLVKVKYEDWSSGSDMVLDSGDSEPSKPTIQLYTDPSKNLANGSSKTYLFDIKPFHQNERNDINDNVCQPKAKGKNQIPPVRLSNNAFLANGKKSSWIGRFLFSRFSAGPPVFLPNESPLRKRITLSFLTSCDLDILPDKKKPIIKKSNTKKDTSKISQRVSTSDAATQCDFMSELIQNLNKKVTELTGELNKLKNTNTSLSVLS